MKKLITLLICIAMVFSMAGCKNLKTARDENKIQIVATIFPLYDFARQVAGDKAQVTLLLPTGAEVHSYEPTPKDVISIKESDLFIYLGDGAEPWAEAVINDADNKSVNSLAAMDGLKLMSEGEHISLSSTVHTDPHIWTSPENAEEIVEAIEEKLCRIDGENARYYKANAERYEGKLSALDEKFEDLTEHKNITMVFADRFPFRYFADEYDIKYLAAYPGCSSESEPSAATVSEIIDRVKKDKIPVVFYTETANSSLADTICEETGAKKEMFHSCHSVTDEQLKEGITYIDLMTQNYETLKKAI